uniref:Uncharacterized protein n=1 Tax=Glossina austeni TaxID=7395 RepID=A0A1A9UJL6_GLOAU
MVVADLVRSATAGLPGRCFVLVVICYDQVVVAAVMDYTHLVAVYSVMDSVESVDIVAVHVVDADNVAVDLDDVDIVAGLAIAVEPVGNAFVAAEDGPMDSVDILLVHHLDNNLEAYSDGPEAKKSKSKQDYSHFQRKIRSWPQNLHLPFLEQSSDRFPLCDDAQILNTLHGYSFWSPSKKSYKEAFCPYSKSKDKIPKQCPQNS